VVGDQCHLGKEVFIDLRSQVRIEDRVTISMRTTIITHFDIGQSPLGRANIPIGDSQVMLKEGCFIGASALILPGVTVGACSLVSAAAVVNRDVPPFHLVAGVPARKIRKIRF
jgi:acetyltransferase-like isoleucine patch superfamily enzyme